MFGFKKKPQPSIKTESYTLVCDEKYDGWSLKYRDIEFTYSQVSIDLPKVETLDLYLSWVHSYKDHFEENVKSMCEGWDDVFADPSKYHIAQIEVESQDCIAVMILGDDTWGDMGYDIWIENGVIKNEGFSD